MSTPALKLTDAQTIDRIANVLWPADDPEAQWSSDEIEVVAELIAAARPNHPRFLPETNPPIPVTVFPSEQAFEAWRAKYGLEAGTVYTDSSTGKGAVPYGYTPDGYGVIWYATLNELRAEHF